MQQDKDVRTVFGLTDVKLGELIGKTRQAINKGLENNRYFKPHEWKLIYLYLCSIKHSKTNEFVDYVNIIYKKNSDKHFIFDIGFSEIFNISSINAEEAVAVIADYRHFRKEHPNCDKILRDLADRMGESFSFLTSLDTDFEIFVESLGGRVQISGGFLPEANQYPDLLCLDPSVPGGQKYLTCISDAFLPLDDIRGQAIFHYISKDLKKKDITNSKSTIERIDAATVSV